MIVAGSPSYSADGHDAIFPVPGVKDGDADHKSGGEVPATGVSDREGLATSFRLLSWRRGPSPHDRRPMCPAQGRNHRTGEAGEAARALSGPFTG